jgi:type II secretory pathway component PulF
MGAYRYKARDERGSLITGSMDADNQRAVYTQLDDMGLFPISVSQDEANSSSFQSILDRFQHVKTDDLIFFTRQLHTIVKAGIPLISGLKALEEQTSIHMLKKIIKEVYQDIDKGTSFSDALARQKNAFPEIYVSMVRAGELGGVLDDILERLAGLLEFQMKTKEMLKSAMRYPVMVVSAIIAAFFILVFFVIPKFAVIFKNSKMELPLPTKIMLIINDIVQSYGAFVIAGIIMAVIGIVMYKRSEKGKVTWDRYKLKLPLIGQIFLKISMSRFAYMFENLIKAGVPIMRTLEIIARTVGNEYIALKISEIGTKIEKGRGISKPLKDSGIFPPLVIHLVATGEDTGSLEEMLKEVSAHYDREITYSVSRLAAWIEPILTAGLAVMVLFLALAVFMPWWNMMGAMKGGGP